MITELIVEEVKTKGSERIKVEQYPTTNQALQSTQSMIGKILRWLMVCQSNNMVRGVQARNVVEFWELWNAHKEDFKNSMKLGNSPAPTHEMYLYILLPSRSEMRRYKNIKVQRVAHALYYYAHVCMSRDSADGTQIWDMADYKDILDAQKAVEATVTLWIGNGQPLLDTDNVVIPGQFNVGIKLPPMSELGQEVPTGDGNSLYFAEPSLTAPDTGIIDAPSGQEAPLPPIK